MITLNDLAEKFLLSSEKRHAPKTTQLYREYMEKLAEALGAEVGSHAEDIKAFYINDYIAAHPEWSDSYKNAMVTAFNTIFNWGVDNDYLEKNPIKKGAICARFDRLHKMTGIDIHAYLIRHGTCTAAIEDGKSEYDIAGASGHKDPSMIRRCYSHVHQDKARLINVFGG